jgi:soluble lytic murein transglycosylase-like protein
MLTLAGLLLTLCTQLGVCEPAMIETLEQPIVTEIAAEHHHHPYRGIGAGVEQWSDLVAVYFEPADRARVLCLMGYESGGNPNALSPTQDYGLMQIHAPIWAPTFGVSYSDLFDPRLNLMLARRILDRQGWTAWSPYKRGLCRG